MEDQRSDNPNEVELSDDQLNDLSGGVKTRQSFDPKAEDDCPPNDCECGECDDNDSSLGHSGVKSMQ